MQSAALLLLLLLLLPAQPLLGADVANRTVVFPSDEEFLALGSPPPGYEDPEDTGSFVFAKDPANARLSRGIPLTAWYDTSAHSFFRAHPALIRCLAAVNSHLALGQTDDTRVRIRIVKGFVPLSQTGQRPAFPLNFHAAGSAAELRIVKGEEEQAGEQRPLLQATMRACATQLTLERIDFGVSVRPSSLLLWLEGEAKGRLRFRADSGELASNEAVERVARAQWERQFLHDLNAGDFPCDAAAAAAADDADDDAERVVAPADAVVRPDTDDFRRLLQYQSSDVDFGDCRQFVGSSASAICHRRLMAPRMYRLLRTVHALAHSRGWRLAVARGWQLTQSPSLANEGRQLDVSAEPSVPARQLAALARCAGADSARPLGANRLVRLAVRKQQSLLSRPVPFASGRGHLLPVLPPAEAAKDYEVVGQTEEAMDDRPLFDGALDPNTPLGESAKLGMFVSSGSRYLRLHQSLPSCYDAVLSRVNRGRGRGAGSPRPPVGVAVLRAYLTELEAEALLDPISDPRAGAHQLGHGMQLAFDAGSPGFDPGLHTPWRLAEEAAVACGPVLFERRSLAAIGVYNSSVFVGVSNEAKVWLQCEPENSEFMYCPLRPPIVSGFASGSIGYRNFLMEKLTQAIQGWVVDPIGDEENCKYDNPPQEQSPGFKYSPPKERPVPPPAASVTAVAAAAGSNATAAAASRCGSSSDFCQKSRRSREQQVQHLWYYITHKHLLLPEEQVLSALEDCLLTCSACEHGPDWSRKLAGCSRLAHWLPFGLENDLFGAVSNLYSAGDQQLRQEACYGGQHCVDWSPLYSLLYPTVAARFRPNPEGAVQEQLYDQEGNPSPLMHIVRRLYATYARGDVKVWVRNEDDVRTMEEELKVVFLYNRRVTSVTLLVSSADAVQTTAAVLDALLDSWVQTACSANSRQYLTPHRVVSAASADAEYVDDAGTRRRRSVKAAGAASAANAVRMAMYPSLHSLDLRHW